MTFYAHTRREGRVEREEAINKREFEKGTMGLDHLDVQKLVKFEDRERDNSIVPLFQRGQRSYPTLPLSLLEFFHPRYFDSSSILKRDSWNEGKDEPVFRGIHPFARVNIQLKFLI